MLKVYGHIYSDSKERFDEVTSALSKQGFEIAYDSDTNATIIKEVEDEQEDSTT